MYVLGQGAAAASTNVPFFPQVMVIRLHFAVRFHNLFVFSEFKLFKTLVKRAAELCYFEMLLKLSLL